MRSGRLRRDRHQIRHAFAPGYDLAANSKDAGLECVHQQQPHLYWSDEAVALVGGVFANHRRELVGQGLLVRRQPVVIVVAELDDKLVGDQGAVAADDGGLVVEFALQRGGYLDRLDLGFEGAGEDAFDDSADPSLEALKYTH